MRPLRRRVSSGTERRKWAKGKRVCHHHARSLEIYWLLLVFAMTLERLWRLRYLHTAPHPPRTAIELLRRLRWSLASPPPVDTS